jgi:hypothetical protein
MARFSRWDRKVLHGATVAAATTAGAALAVTLIHSDQPLGFFDRLMWVLQSDIYTSVGIPAFVAGVLFFPVGILALRSRFGFAARAALTAAAVSFVNRVLVWASFENPDSLFKGLQSVWANPSMLWPSPFDTVALGLDWNAILGLTATAIAAGLAWAAQPLLKRIAKQPRLESISAFDAGQVRAPARVGVR